jgi:taurine transport system ATP-binding protein
VTEAVTVGGPQETAGHSPTPAGDDGAPVRLEGVSQWFGNDPNPLVLDDITLDIEAGEFVSIVGPSGCGKSTLLGLVAGFDTPRQGRVLIDGSPVKGPAPDRGMVFQQPRLFSWMRVLDNVSFGPRVQGMSAQQANDIAVRTLELVGLSGEQRKWPHELSGGMQQRVAIARALAAGPDVLLMDEPFAALDALTRERLQDEVLDIWRRRGITVLFVTHSVDEAAYLSTRIIALDRNPGRVCFDEKAGLGAVPDRAGLRSTPAFLSIRDRLHDVVVRAAGG